MSCIMACYGWIQKQGRDLSILQYCWFNLITQPWYLVGHFWDLFKIICTDIYQDIFFLCPLYSSVVSNVAYIEEWNSGVTVAMASWAMEHFNYPQECLQPPNQGDGARWPLSSVVRLLISFLTPFFVNAVSRLPILLSFWGHDKSPTSRGTLSSMNLKRTWLGDYFVEPSSMETVKYLSGFVFM